MTRPSRHLPVVVAFLLVCAVTLLPTEGEEMSRTAWCIICGDLGTLDFVLNVALFVPIGASLIAAGWSARRALLASVAATLVIELLQLRVITGRDASIGDLVANAIGAGIGVALARHWEALRRPAAATARALTLAYAASFLAVLAGTAWALGRSLPDARYFGQWRHVRSAEDRLRPIVLGAGVNGHALDPDLITVRGELARELRGDTVSLAAIVLPGPPTRRYGSIVSVATHPARKLLALSQRDTDLVFRVRFRASDAGLRSPAFGIARAFPPQLAARRDTMWLAGSYRPGELRITARSSGHTMREEITLGPGLGWSLLMPVDVRLGTGAMWLNALWIAALVVPLVYWATWGWRRWSGAAAAGLIVAVGLALLPAVTTLAGATLWEWLGAAAGVAFGAIAGEREVE